LLFRELQAGGMTIVVSSHILAELDQYSTDMLVLKGGRIVEQRALAGGVEERERRMQATLAAPDSRAAGVLAAHGSVTEVASNGTELAFVLRGDEAAQASVLRALVEAGIAVVAFGESRENLHDSYLRTVAGDKP
jgi:ABC-2 type transport system ATP-binding protein